MERSNKKMNNKYIKAKKDILKFADFCTTEIGLGFHWDTHFEDYIHNKNDKKMFSKKRSEILNQKLDECLNLNYDYFVEIIMNWSDRHNLEMKGK
jgi:hypothetical protein